MPNSTSFSPAKLARDFTAGLVVFLVALPLCLGVALASGAEPFAGMLAGIVGGMVVGWLSGSHTSVSGPSPAPAAIIAAQIALLGSFDAFLLAVVIAGVIQIGFGLARGGFLAAFFPSSVVKGLLAAVGVILILKQLPHVVGHDADPEGDMAFFQPDHENTFSEIISLFGDLHAGAAIVGGVSLAVLVLWEFVKALKTSNVPAPLVVVGVGIGLNLLFDFVGGPLDIQETHLVQVPVANGLSEFSTLIQSPNFAEWANPAIWMAGFTIAIVASLETLLNLNASDKLDQQQRVSPPNRELFVQGIGNVVVGLLGGIPIASAIVRSSVNINAGGKSKIATIVHGVLLLVCVMFLPKYLNMIPLSCLAAILLVTGVKLASPALVKQMWTGGRYQFFPFVVTLSAIVLTDLVVGILIGLAVSISFILYSNLRRPLRRIIEKHVGGDVLLIELANQVSFLNRPALEKTLRAVPRGGHVLLDASRTDYIDPDVLDLIRDFKDTIAPAHGVQVSLRGFRSKYQLQDEIQFIDYSTRELQEQLTSAQVLQILQEGNERFRTGRRLSRDLDRLRDATSKGQHPLAVILSCIDSRAPAEIIFDLGLGDIFNVRVAGNVVSPKILGSMEYACAVAGAKLILVMGHTHCGAVSASVKFAFANAKPEEATGCQHLEPIVLDIQQSIDASVCQRLEQMSDDERTAFIDSVARRNVLRARRQILRESRAISRLVSEDKIAVVGAIYDVSSGKIDVLVEDEPNGAITESLHGRITG